MSLGLYLARVLISVHLWSFRKPDAPLAGQPQREPGPIAGLPAPVITEPVVDRWPAGSPLAGQPLAIRLTRYARPGGKPLVMIHGYSVSGNTFTHASLAPSAAAYFWDQGRDVWVLDMRTSTALDSATWPWAMEQPALIDIPAALLHVHQATGQRVDVLAHCIGCVMLSMALLADARSIRRGEIELGPDTWLTRKHLDRLAAFNGSAPQGRPHAVVDRVVLSQKGPVLRYSDDNILRAFVMQYLRRWLLAGDYQFRPSAEPGVSEQLLDRLLASLPYPDAEFRVENPLLPWARTSWVASRHRMDALYGRDFNAANMAPEVLQAIDDLFGPINLDTVSQTIHFARWDAITNQAGRGEFVTRANLRRAWAGIPTLGLHGEHNGPGRPLHPGAAAAGLRRRRPELPQRDPARLRPPGRFHRPRIGARVGLHRALPGRAGAAGGPGGAGWLRGLRALDRPAPGAAAGRRAGADRGDGAARLRTRQRPSGCAAAPLARRCCAARWRCRPGAGASSTPALPTPGDAWLCVLIYSARQLPPLRAGSGALGLVRPERAGPGAGQGGGAVGLVAPGRGGRPARHLQRAGRRAQALARGPEEAGSRAQRLALRLRQLPVPGQPDRRPNRPAPRWRAWRTALRSATARR
jgi:hypothetical protein